MFTAFINFNFSIMLKNILNLKGTQILSKNEQQAVTGGCPQNNTGDGVCFVNGCIIRWECSKRCPDGGSPLGC
jgi:hypothetical protein